MIYKRFERSKLNELWQIDNVGPFYKPGKLRNMEYAVSERELDILKSVVR